MKATSTILTISATILATLLAVQGALGQNPRQAGHSSVYLYDVAATDARASRAHERMPARAVSALEAMGYVVLAMWTNL